MTWTERYFSALKGAKILDAKIGDGDVPVLIVHLAGEPIPREVGIMCDPEGNGPGWIDNLPKPQVESPAPETVSRTGNSSSGNGVGRT